MEEKELKRLIERFFDAEMTVEEERALCRYLRDNDVPTELRKDKDAIIALCGEPADVQLPVGAMERLETLIDGLEPKQEQCITERTVAVEKKMRLLKIPHYVAAVAAAVAVLLMAYIFIPSDNLSSSETTGEILTEFYEEDTFDNPEDAMRCVQMAFANVQHAVTATQINMSEIGSILKQSVKMYK